VFGWRASQKAGYLLGYVNVECGLDYGISLSISVLFGTNLCYKNNIM
jgi:hypothetical protein